MTEDLIKTILTVAGGVLGGIIAAVITARNKVHELEENYRLTQLAKENEERAKNQLQYLNPLRVSAMDLHGRLSDIDDRIARKDSLLIDTLKELKEKAEDTESFVPWANGFGEFALSTLYITLIYFARAGTIRTELPFVQLSAGDDNELLDRLSNVRRSLGGEYGIWSDLQDSLGSYLRRPEGRGLLSYREFCTELSKPSSFPWFNRAVRFYRDLNLKKPAERKEMIDSLNNLAQFLAEKPKQTARGL